jgi:hypothetical protein
MEIQFHGYPVEIFYSAAIIGLVLVIFRPRWAFLFIVFCLAIRHYKLSVFTRTPFFGEFLNLNDLFLWIGFLAMVRTTFHDQKIWIPNILLAIICINLLGDFQVLALYGFDHKVMQSCWGSWVFPILFATAVNMVRNENDARYFFWALFLGSLGAALQHMFFIQGRMSELTVIEATSAQGGIRTIAFMGSGGIFLLISALFLDIWKILKKFYLLIFWIMSLPFIAMSYILSFTRTVWLGAALAVVAITVLLFRERRKMLTRFGYALVLITIMYVGFYATERFFLSGFDVSQSIDQRADFIRYEDTFENAYQTRETGMDTELNLWQNGSIIWGVGSSYPPSLIESSLSSIEETGALGHVAFSTYLAHFGLIGLFTYGLLLPFLTIKIAWKYHLRHKTNYSEVIAITGMALAFFDIFTLLSSNQYIAPNGHVQALIYGALWGVCGPQAVNSVRSLASRIMTQAPMVSGTGRPTGR